MRAIAVADAPVHCSGLRVGEKGVMAVVMGSGIKGFGDKGVMAVVRESGSRGS